MKTQVLEDYKNNKISGTLTSEQYNLLFSEIRSLIPSFIKEVEKFDKKETQDKEIINNLNFCSQIIRKFYLGEITRVFGQKEYQNQIDNMNNYIEAANKIAEKYVLTFGKLSLTDQFIVSPLSQKSTLESKKINAVSGWMILKGILSDNNPENNFLIYMYMFSDQKELDMIKRSWSFYQYFINYCKKS